jgi:hypothetical protein
MEVRLLLSLKLHLSLQGDHLPHLARTRAKDERKEEDQGNPYGEGGLEELAGEILISFHESSSSEISAQKFQERNREDMVRWYSKSLIVESLIKWVKRTDALRHPQEILSQLQIIGVKGIGPVPVEQSVQLAKEEALILPFCIEGHG